MSRMFLKENLTAERLVEEKAPEGYEIAEAVEFTIPEKLAADQNYVVEISMTDKKTEEKVTPTPTPSSTPSPAPSNSGKSENSSFTGDDTRTLGLALIAVCSASFAILFGKKRKEDEE